MVRFIDIGTQTGNSETKEFCFFDTTTDKFLEFYDSQTWDSAKSFIEDFTKHGSGRDLARFINLIPMQFFINN